MALKLLEQEVKTKNKVSADIVFQLALTLFTLYVANKISIDVWRSIRGH
jgi:hypothetical protein